MVFRPCTNKASDGGEKNFARSPPNSSMGSSTIMNTRDIIDVVAGLVLPKDARANGVLTKTRLLGWGSLYILCQVSKLDLTHSLWLVSPLEDLRRLTSLTSGQPNFMV